MDLLIYLGFSLFLLFLGFVVGKRKEKRHYADIRRREAQYADIPQVAMKRPPLPADIAMSSLATGSVVVSVDYFKALMAKLRMFFGGELMSYSSLIDRARREAILRMIESSPGASLFMNIRLETSSISKGRKDQVGAVEVMAYGTAVWERPAGNDLAT